MTRVFRSPGRVNLIGDHTDYNDGLVLPIALEQATWVAALPRSDLRLRVETADLGESAEVDLDAPSRARPATWMAYVEGVARTLRECGAPLRGAELRIRSDLPMGAGLSSSAALGVGVGLALLGLSGTSLPVPALARAVQESEHRYAGARVGIMDPMAILLGRAGHALLLDCGSLASRHVPLRLADHEIVLADSRVRHANASSGYNDRRAGCEQALLLLRAHRPGLASLSAIAPQELPALLPLLPEVLRPRVRHVVSENARTRQAAEALARGDVTEVGRLMLLSHRSLRDDYGVSVPELDFLVELAQEGRAAGARMTGGGFGGCTVALVPRSGLHAYGRRLRQRFAARFGQEPVLRTARSADGAAEIAAERVSSGNVW